MRLLKYICYNGTASTRNSDTAPGLGRMWRHSFEMPVIGNLQYKERWVLSDVLVFSQGHLKRDAVNVKVGGILDQDVG